MRKIVAAGIVAGLACAGQARSWDLANDWTNTSANPNGTWSYGQLTPNPPGAPTFSLLSYLNSNGFMGSAEFGSGGTALIYKPTSVPGITPGQVDLNATDANPDVRWTSPYKMIATITAVVGGKPGNTFANTAVLTFGGLVQTGAFNATTNTMSWTLTGASIASGEILELEVPDPGGNVFPNTQTQIHIAYILPEPAPFLAVGLGVLGLLLRRRK